MNQTQTVIIQANTPMWEVLTDMSKRESDRDPSNDCCEDCYYACAKPCCQMGEIVCCSPFKNLLICIHNTLKDCAKCTIIGTLIFGCGVVLTGGCGCCCCVTNSCYDGEIDICFIAAKSANQCFRYVNCCCGDCVRNIALIFRDCQCSCCNMRISCVQTEESQNQRKHSRVSPQPAAQIMPRNP